MTIIDISGKKIKNIVSAQSIINNLFITGIEVKVEAATTSTFLIKGTEVEKIYENFQLYSERREAPVNGRRKPLGKRMKKDYFCNFDRYGL